MSYLETAGKRHAIPAGEFRIGRDPSAHLVLSGDGVDATHAIVQSYEDGQVAIRRAAEQALILINGVRLGPQPTPLLHGDKVQVGSHELLFVDERRSGSTQYVPAVDPAALAAMARPSAKPREATAATGGRVVSLTDGREYVVSGSSTVFGRDAGCDIVITDKNVSRRHAEIMASPKGYVLIDSSTNGTFVNGERIDGQRLLARAEVIRIGNDEFRFYADRAPAVQSVAPAAPGGTAPTPAPEAGGEPPRVPPPAAQAAPPPSAGAPPAPPPPAAGHRLADTTAGVPGMARGAPVAALEKTSDAARTADVSQRGAGAAPLASLVVRSGSMKGQRIPIRVPVINVGRANYNDVVLPDDSVSTSHAKVQRREGVWVLLDLDSTNGTFVDGERVKSETPLAPGALVRFGDIQVLFEPTDDTIDAARGSSTKMLNAVKPAPAAATPAPPSRIAMRAAPDRAGPAAAAPKPSGAPQARRPALRPRSGTPAPGGTPKWLVPAVLLAAVAAILFLLLR